MTNKTRRQHNQPKLRILPSGDPRTAFHHMTPTEVVDAFGRPWSLLSTSKKTDKSLSVGVVTRIIYFTPGALCPAATAACLESCLGHTSGRMVLPSSTNARDRKTAFYLTDPDKFIERLTAELTLFTHEAKELRLRPAVRLNGTSDIPWERLHPELFGTFPEISYFDYTKIRSRMDSFLNPKKTGWPENYHLTFSLDQDNRHQAIRFLEQGGTVAAVFWPNIPSSWLNFSVIDGDVTDARFLDPTGSIVGLRAKGRAQVDTDGFTIRLCPYCPEKTPELSLKTETNDTHRTTTHECSKCRYQLRAKWKLPNINANWAVPV